MPDLRNHRQLAPTAAVYVSPLCLGAMSFGTAQGARMGECTKETAFAILDKFYAAGGNFLDTANAYQNGESEQWLGEWMAARQNRDEMVIATKYTAMFLSPESLTNSNGTEKIISNFRGNGAKSLRTSLAASLRNLGSSYIDLFYVHWWEHTTTIPELMHALNDLVTQGKVLYLGASDTPAWVVARANQYARDHGLRQFTVYQGIWNAGMRDMEREILPMCAAEGMGICPYGVLGSGTFQTEEVCREREAKMAAEGTHEGRTFRPVTEHDKRVSRVLEGMARRKGCALAQVALAYVRFKDPNVFVIVGARKLGHLESSIEALGISLTEEEVQEIDSSYQFDHGFPSTFLSGYLVYGGVSKPVMGPQDVAVANINWLKPVKAASSD